MALPEKEREREEYIISLYRQGLSLREIANKANEKYRPFFGREHDISHNGVQNLLRRKGLKGLKG